ncbi:MAG: hypothetical protein HY077_12625 [Elusimicrobia bacterium]|nr:hypothetical protein [Elusimicrobiota bacterium]
MRGLAPGLLVLSLAGCAALSPRPRGETVTAEGWAALDAKDPCGTKARALAEAQRRAVEKAAGVTVRARTTVEAAVELKQKITADARGRIERFEVLEEKREDGFLKVRIRALLVLEPAPEKQDAFPPDLKFALEVPAEAAQALRQGLLDRGGILASAEAKPDLLIRGKAQTKPFRDPRVRPFFSSRASLTVEAVDAATGTVLWTKTQEAAALGSDPESASASAVASASASLAAADELARVLWNRF